MEVPLCYVLLLIICQSFGVCGQPPNAPNMDTQLDQLENSESPSRRRIEEKYPNLDIELENEVKKQLPGLLEQSLKNVLKTKSLKAMLKGTVMAEVRKLRKKYKKLKKQLRDTNDQMDIIENKNDQLEKSVLSLQNEVSSLNEYPKENPSGANTREITTATSVSTGETIIAATVSSGKMSRILFLPWGHDDPQQIQIDSMDQSVYPLQMRGYQSVAYVHKTHSIITTVIEPFNFGNMIYISDLDNNVQRVLVSGQATHGIAVDETRGLVFLTIFTPSKSVSSMHLDGGNVTEVANMSSYSFASGIAVDTTTQTIYVCAEDRLMSMTYEGRDVNKIYSGSSMRAVTVDASGGFVYFNNDQKMMQLSLVDGSTSLVRDLPYLPWNFIHYRDADYDVVYVSSFRGRQIGRVEIASDQAYVPILTSCSPCHYTTAICLLP